MNAPSENLSLGWISSELDSHIAASKNAFESYLSGAEEKQDSSRLVEVLQHLDGCIAIFKSTELNISAEFSSEIRDVVQGLIDKSIACQTDAYQVVIGGINQLLNYLERLKQTGGENPAALLVVTNDIRAVSGKSLCLNSGRFEINNTGHAGENCLESELLNSLARVEGKPFNDLCRAIQSSLELIARQPEEQRQALLKIKQIFSELNSIACETSVEVSLLAEMIWAMSGVVGGALNNGNRLGISARYTFKTVFNAFSDLIAGMGENTNWQQLHSELLYCLSLCGDCSEGSIYLKNKYQLDSAIKSSREELLFLGTPDAESISIVLDGLSDEIVALQNGLQATAEANGQFSSAIDVSSMAVNLQYTLRIMQFDSMASQLDSVIEILGETVARGSIELDSLELVISKLFDLDASIQKIKAGSGRGSAEISVIEQLQASVKSIQEVSFRCASLDVERAIKLADERHIATEMKSVLQPLPKMLVEIEGASRFIQGDHLTGAVKAIAQYYASHIETPLAGLDIPAARQGCENLGKATQVLENYLGALKESNHALVDNLLLEVGRLTGCCSLTATAHDSGASVEAYGSEPLINNLQEVNTDTAGSDVVEDDKPEVTEIDQPGSFEQVFAEAPLEEELDDEIVEIFLEEAEEVFESINENYQQLQQDRSDSAALAEIRRGYHTLKGSGRMAGAEDIGNAAWSIENLLNRIIDTTVSLDDVRLAMIEEANQYLPLLVDYFQRRVKPFAPALESLMERADILSKDAAATVELNQSLQLEQNKGAVNIPEDNTLVEAQLEQPSVESVESTVDQDVVQSHESIHAEAEQVVPVEADEPESSGDKVCEIFLAEARLQLRILEEYCSSTEQSGAIRLPEDEVERAFHTLSGGARIAGIESLATIMASSEKLVVELRRQPCVDERHYMLIQQAVQSLQNFVADSYSGFDDNAQLVASLEDARAELVCKVESPRDESDRGISSYCSLIFEPGDFLKTWRVSAAPPASFADMRAELHQLSEDSFCDGVLSELSKTMVDAYDCFATNGLHYQAYWLLSQAHNYLVDMLDCVAAGQSVVEQKDKAGLLQELRDTVLNDLAQASDDACRAKQTGTATKTEQARKLDQEIVGIFLEESTDLIEEVEANVSAWVENQEDSLPLEALLRPLHTLKGGARMAGLEGIGDLCHEFETLIQGFSNGDVEVDARFSKQLQKHFNQLTNAFGDIAENGIAAGSPENSGARVSEAGEQKMEEKRKAEPVRVSSDLLDRLVNLAGETSISRSLIEERLTEFNYSIDEIESTVERLKEQLRRLEIETEAQIAFRKEKVEIAGQEEFDPLEMDRYSHLQQLSKSLVESASDLKDLKGTLRDKTRDVETLLLQQSRINTELQEGLMQTRTVPISRTIVPRLRKVIRQVSGELDKPVTFKVGSSDGELDKAVIERMVAPLEHVLRNAIDHGIESTEDRINAGKPAAGAISMVINREGSDVVLRISDDGKGIDKSLVAKKAVQNGLLESEQDLTDEILQQILFSPGFSTASSVTQISGRGVGMDVVKSELQELGGSVELQTSLGKGTTFTFRLPFTMSMNRALLVSAGGESIAVPLETIEGIVRVSPYELEEYYGENAVDFLYAGHKYDFRYLGAVLNGSEPQYSQDMVGALPVLLVRAEDQLIAYQIDRLLGSREIVVKSLGPQFTGLPGIIGATVLGDGSVVMIADLGALDSNRKSSQQGSSKVGDQTGIGSRERPIAMVVDDSVTVRKVTTRFLERQGLDVITAKDGLEAMEMLEETKPDFILLDIEMPRLDGFEVVSRVRHDPRLQDIPIIMITSRTGEKHRDRALSLGANEYLGKPFQEQVLFSKIAEVAPQIANQYAVAE